LAVLALPFIPQGLAHNIINSDSKKPLSIISVYSETDIPAGTTNEKKSDSKE
jgi:oxalate decarboxylase/phosphoglucose isomerase-like protein (cupin superfamily)